MKLITSLHLVPGLEIYDDVPPVSHMPSWHVQGPLYLVILFFNFDMQDIIEWTEVRRRGWDAHVGRMEDNRLAKIARDSHPQGVRSRGRPKKRKESLIKAPPTLTSGRKGISL
jgi:hypothetical protein